jgi:hypothetical protein
MGQVMIAKAYKYWNILGCFLFLLLVRSSSWAQFNTGEFEDYDGQSTARAHAYQLITGAFGTLIIVFCAMAGFVMLIMTRQGRAGKNAPLLGVGLLFIAAFFFAFRVLIKSGFLGHEYLQF